MMPPPTSSRAAAIPPTSRAVRFRFFPAIAFWACWAATTGTTSTSIPAVGWPSISVTGPVTFRADTRSSPAKVPAVDRSTYHQPSGRLSTMACRRETDASSTTTSLAGSRPIRTVVPGTNRRLWPPVRTRSAGPGTKDPGTAPPGSTVCARPGSGSTTSSADMAGRAPTTVNVSASPSAPPMCTVPWPERRSSVTRVPPLKVPDELPTSTRVQLLPSGRISACWRETVPPVSGMSEEGSRPIVTGREPSKVKVWPAASTCSGVMDGRLGVEPLPWAQIARAVPANEGNPGRGPTIEQSAIPRR